MRESDFRKTPSSSPTRKTVGQDRRILRAVSVHRPPGVAETSEIQPVAAHAVSSSSALVPNPSGTDSVPRQIYRGGDQENNDVVNVQDEDDMPVKQEDLSAAVRGVSRTPRRFHMSRSLISTISKSPSGIVSRKRESRRPAVFMERGRHSKYEKSKASVPVQNSTTVQSLTTGEEGRTLKKPGVRPVQVSVPADVPAAATPSQLAAEALKNNPRNPLGWDNNTDELTAQMQAFTMQQIGLAYPIATEVSEEATSTPTTPKGRKTRFKPKLPSQRYNERHPEHNSTPYTGPDVNDDLQRDETTDDEDDYIIDTYIRVRGETMLSNGEPENIGLLVLDSQPDIDEFYISDSDSDSDLYDEEEDENGRLRISRKPYNADYCKLRTITLPTTQTTKLRQMTNSAAMLITTVTEMLQMKKNGMRMILCTAMRMMLPNSHGREALGRVGSISRSSMMMTTNLS